MRRHISRSQLIRRDDRLFKRSERFAHAAANRDSWSRNLYNAGVHAGRTGIATDREDIDVTSAFYRAGLAVGLKEARVIREATERRNR